MVGSVCSLFRAGVNRVSSGAVYVIQQVFYRLNDYPGVYSKAALLPEVVFLAGAFRKRASGVEYFADVIRS